MLSWLWVPVVLVAATAQTFRNATQSSLTGTIGAAGATQVRFIYGLPFALVFLGIVCVFEGHGPSMPNLQGMAFLAAGAVAQILATAIMLKAMHDSGFALVTALIKVEPILVAIAGFIVLDDPLTTQKLLAILLVCAGVILLGKITFQNKSAMRALLLGMAAGGFFGVAAIGFRGAILSIEQGGFVMRATTVLVMGLGLQAAILAQWLLIMDRKALTGSLSVWRQSLLAGFLGALASQFWFLGFALTSAANVRTLALIEVPMAQALSRKLFNEKLGIFQTLGLVLMMVGVIALIHAG
jgi:drug/metabolite transporter (DMT)-like permease